MDNDLAAELSAIDGVEDAELSFGDDGVAGVRVRLEVDADADGVGKAVQEVMSRHGVRTRLGDAPPPPPVGAVVSLADRPSAMDPVSPAPDEGQLVRPIAEAPQPIFGASVAGVAVSEGSNGLEVTVTTADGRSQAQRCRGGDQSIAEAVTMATASLFGDGGAVLVEYRRETIADHEVVTVVVDVGTQGHVAGAAVVGAGFPFAVARAVWAALGA